MKKRIALAAVAALAGGLLVAAPASAATSTTYLTSGNVTFDGASIAGPSNFVNVNVQETATGTSAFASARVVISGSTILAVSDTNTDALAASQVSSTEAVVGNADTIKVSAVSAGTITVKVYFAESVGTFSTTAQVATFVVGVNPAPAAYNHTTVSALGAFSDGAAAYTDANGGAFVPAKIATAGMPETVTAFSIKQYASVDTATPAGSLSKAVTVSLSGVGVISDGVNNNVTYLAYSAGGADVRNIVVSRDGRSGVATITIAIDGVVVATRVVTFYGAIASFGLSISNAQLAAGGAFTLTLTKKDSNGIAVPTPANWSAETATAGFGTVYQYVPGTETRTVTYGSKLAAVVTAGNGLVDTKTVVANWVTAGVASVVLTADKASYAPGEKATFTVTAKNADGVAVGDSTSYSLALGGSAALYGYTGTVTIKNGVGTFTAYMPVVQGPVVVAATVNGTATGSVSVAVVDAAAAAQAAAITALQTSVATLTTTVASLVASMTAQIKVINATMLKIQKAIAALRLQLKRK